MLGTLAFSGLVLPQSAGARSSYCSPSGDICTSVVRKSGAVYLRIGAAAQYFKRYRLCVTTPRPRTTCRVFRLLKDETPQGTLYGSTVRWSKYFPRQGDGVYRVAWFAGNRLGPRLSFRIR